MRRSLLPWIILGSLIIILVNIIWFAVPAWRQQPAGLWITALAGGIGVLALIAEVVTSRRARPDPPAETATPPPTPAAQPLPAAESADGPRFTQRGDPRFSITAPPTDFVGREEELQALLADFDRGALITSANGSAGVGLTALAYRLAQVLAERFPDGCLEINLQGAAPTLIEPTDPVEVQRRLLRPFCEERQLPEDPNALNKLYRKIFAKHSVLLLLDNAAGESQLRRLLPRSPSAAIVTSRAELFMSRGGLYPLKLTGLRPEDGRALLGNIVPELGQESPGVLSKLAERFEYNPLGLKIAGALLRAPYNWLPRTLLRRAEEARKRLVALRTEDDPNISATVALDLIYDVLSPELRNSFESLAVFPYPFTLSAAAAIWGLNVQDADKIMIALVRSNLVDYYPDRDTYMLHDLTRLYAQEILLGQMERAREILARYAHYTLREAALANAHYRKNDTDADEAHLRFTQNWPHLWTAWTRYSDERAGWPQPSDADRWVCDFPIRVRHGLQVMLPTADRLPIVERALAAAQRLGDRKVQGIHLGTLGRIHTHLGNQSRALEYHEQHLQIAYELKDRHGEADALMHVGLACGALGDVQRAQESWRQALRLFGIIGDPRAQRVKMWLEELEKRSA